MKTISSTTMLTTPEYRQFIEDLKARVTAARISAARAVNRDLILLYWDIGRAIVEKQQALGWGESVVEMVSTDLRRAFPEVSGFSSRNVWYMRRFYEAYTNPEFLAQAVGEIERSKRNQIPPQAVADLPDKAKAGEAVILRQAVAELKLGDTGASAEFLPQLVAEIPWGHHRLILDKITDPAARLYYLHATTRFGWSRNVLLNQIKAGAYERAVKEKKTHNFPLALPETMGTMVFIEKS